MKDALSITTGLEKQQWMKVPYGTWKFFSKCGYTCNEMVILMFFYYKLCYDPASESTVVFATTQEIMDFAGVTRSTFYNAIDKMYQKGLKKIASNTYDLKEFLEKMNLRGGVYNTGAKTTDGKEIE